MTAVEADAVPLQRPRADSAGLDGPAESSAYPMTAGELDPREVVAVRAAVDGARLRAKGLRAHGYFDRARRELYGALMLVERVLPPDNHVLVALLDELGQVARCRGDLDEAEAAYRRALSLTNDGRLRARLVNDLVDLGSTRRDGATTHD